MQYTESVRKVLDRHFRSMLSGLPSKEWTANRADPTAVERHTGYVTFLYDPWLSEGEEQQFHPYMLTTYKIEVTSSWGWHVRLELLSQANEPEGGFVHEFYVDDSGGEWDQLDKLLDADRFDAKLADAEASVAAIVDPVPDYPHNI